MKKETRLIFILLFIIGVLSGALGMMWIQSENQPENRVQFSEVKRNTSIEDVSKGIHRVGFGEISEKTRRSVVYIVSEVNMLNAHMPKDGNHDFDPDFWDRFFPRQQASMVGSGVIISDNGYILTNNHVIDGAKNGSISVMMNNNQTLEAELVGTDPSTDLAVLKVDTPTATLPGIIIGNSDDIFVGDWVLAVGNPFRLRSTVTAGIISAIGRNVSIIDDRMRIEHFIQTDAAINKGNSGGALVNLNGELIGINTAIATESGGYEGYGFAIPSNLAMKVARDLIEYGQVQRAYLGIQIADVSETRARESNLPTPEGVDVVGVAADGAAAKGGLMQGDIILGIEDTPVRAFNELQARVALYRPGDTITVAIWRNELLERKQVILKGLETESVQSWLSSDERGMRSPITTENESEIGSIQTPLGFSISQIRTLEGGNMIVISSIEATSEAAKSGIKRGYQIIKIDGKEVLSANFIIDYLSTLNTHQSFILTVKTPDDTEAYYSLKKP